MSAPLAERDFVGALMHQSAARVLALAGMVRAEDLADPRLGVVYSGVVSVAATGGRPDPATVDAYLREAGMVRGSDRAAVVALIVDLYATVPLPGAVESYARAVVQEAVRRRVATAAERLAQAADCSPLDGLVTVVASEAAALVTECARLEAAPLAVVA